MRKLSTVIGLSALIGLASPVSQANWEYNFLIGASAGYGDRDGNLNYGSTSPAPASVPSAVILNHSDNGFIWGLLAGVQATCNGWVFGLELNVDWHDFDDTSIYSFIDATATPVNLSARFDRGTIVGVSFRGGYEVAPYLLPYFRLGAETSEDNLTTSGALLPAGPTFNLAADRRTYRFLGGVGLEIPLQTVPGLAFRGEYNFHSKGKVLSSAGIATDNATLVDIAHKPKTHSAKFSVVWNFV